MIVRPELLAPAGDMNKLKTAVHFGADAVYAAGKAFGLRAFSGNFTDAEIAEAAKYLHNQGKKLYITVNIFARNSDFGLLKEFIKILENANVDGVIVSDTGVAAFIKKYSKLDIHLSTQANTTNKYAVDFWKDFGIKRVVLARELSIDEIREIADYVAGKVELEAFIHGAMCMAYSGRCYLSHYLSGRDGNRGECVQACRWEYVVHEKSRANNPLTVTGDERGTYILNSKDLCTMPFLEKLMDAGISSFKVEGRMKSEFYVATVINAYRKRIDAIMIGTSSESLTAELMAELEKAGNRGFTSGFYLGDEAEINAVSSKTKTEYEFIAEVLGYDHEKKALIVEQRNRFFRGDTLEILSAGEHLNKTIVCDEIFNEDGELVEDCKLVQQKLFIKSDIILKEQDILRRSKK